MTKWSMRMPVSCSTWCIVQAGPPTENASFHITSVRAGDRVRGRSSRHSGRSTRESRGMLTPYARCRSAERCSRIVVSDRLPPPVRLSMLLPGASRSSEPITRMLSGSLGPSTSFFSGRSDELGRDVDDVEVAVVVPVEVERRQPGDQREHDDGDQEHAADGVPLLDPCPSLRLLVRLVLGAVTRVARGVAGLRRCALGGVRFGHASTSGIANGDIVEHTTIHLW